MDMPDPDLFMMQLIHVETWHAIAQEMRKVLSARGIINEG